MPKDSPKKNGTPPPGAAPGKPRKQEGAFDIFLNRSLHKMFDDITTEPIPDHLLKLIEEDRNR